MKYLAIIGLLGLAGCTSSQGESPKVYADYPKEIGELMLTKCAISGCHNDASKNAAAGLSLSTWEKLFEGTTYNAVVVPYRADQSILHFFINTYSDLGPVITPTMPYNAAVLSREEVIMVRDWINRGAPNKDGFIKFSDNPTRSKYYVLNSKCKMVAVFDAATDRVMRYIDIPAGENDFIESVRVAPSGNFWYVLLTSGKLLRYATSTDTYLAETDLGSGLWRGLEFTTDNIAIACNYSGYTNYSGGEIVMLNAFTGDIIKRFNNHSDSIYFPQHCAVATSNFYATANQSNFIYKISNTATVTKVKLNPAEGIVFNSNAYRPGNVLASDNYQKYYVACTRSNEIRVFDISTDELLEVINVGAFPNEMVLAEDKLFVSCTEDEQSFAGSKGSVYVINPLTNQVIKKINTGYQPKGMVFNKYTGVVLVANRNADPTGADKPHHYTDCEGNNGYVTAIDIKSLELTELKAEVSVDPYSIAYKH